MANLEDLILSALARKSYEPLKPKALARKLGVPAPQYADFRRALRSLLQHGRIEIGKNHTVRPAPPHGTVTGTYRRTGTGDRLRPAAPHRRPAGHRDAHRRGGRARRRHRRRGPRPPHAQTESARPTASGKIVRVLERASRNFVGTYFERDGQGFVRVDGTVFSHSIYVGDPGAKGAGRTIRSSSRWSVSRRRRIAARA